MKLRIKLHSFVDVITNSSTVIYTTVNENGVQMVRDMIDEILSNITGTTVNSEDLYDVAIVPSGGALEGLVDKLVDDEEDEGLMAIYDGAKDLSWGERWGLCTEYVKNKYSPEEIAEMVEDYCDGERYYSDELLITSKQGKESKLDSILGNLFSSEATYG